MGKLIVFEGTDGSGKSTQFSLLTKRLEVQGQPFFRLVFPQYQEESSALIRMYLAGEFGNRPGDVNAYAASTFYAVDRFASYRKVWKPIYEAGTPILSDRYTTSNAVHQGAKLEPPAREAFFQWLYEMEYDRMELPRPDLVIYLDMPTEVTRQLMRKRERETSTTADIHEKDLVYLALCRQTGLEAASYYGWRVISCARDGAPRPIKEIHEEIFALVQNCLEA